MQSGFRGADAWLASGLLCLLTLGVFAVLQYSGPESTIRRYHMAAAGDDLDLAAELVAQNRDDPVVAELRLTVRELARFGGTFQIRKVEDQRRRAVAQVVYTFQSGMAVTEWVAVRPTDHSRWSIDAYATLANLYAVGIRRNPSPPGF